MRKYRASNQLCGPANRNTVTIDTCSGSQLATAAETIVLQTMIAAKTPADTLVCERGFGPDHAAAEMFSTRSIGTHASRARFASIRLANLCYAFRAGKTRRDAILRQAY
jgi:hypothetical protein